MKNNNIVVFDTEQDQHLFVWPWTGVLANIPLRYKNSRFVGPTGPSLRQQLSDCGFNPLRVELLCTHRGHSGFALVDFQQGLKGLDHATLFEHTFKATGCGKPHWNHVVEENKLYGWVAREDDYKFHGIVAYHLRDKFKGFKEDPELLQQQHSLIVDHHQRSSFCVEDLIKHKDHMLHRYHQDMREAHHSAQRNLENIISRRAMVTVLLEAKKQEIEMRRRAALVEGEAVNGTDFGKIHNEKHKIEKATLEQRKGDDSLVILVEKHKKEKEKLHIGIIDFEKGIEDKHMLELEMARIRGALKVMRHMGDAGDDDEIAERIHTILEQLKKKEQEYNTLVATNQTLFLNEGMKDLKESSGNTSRGIKRGGDFESKSFLNLAIKRNCSEEKAVMSLDSEWNKCLQDPNSNPFVTLEGSIKEEIDIDDDEKLKCLPEEHGDEAYNAGGRETTLNLK